MPANNRQIRVEFHQLCTTGQCRWKFAKYVVSVQGYLCLVLPRTTKISGLATQQTR